jgi:hypothetical protein
MKPADVRRLYVWLNEALDCRVLNLAVIRILQQHRGVDLTRLAAMRDKGIEEHEKPSRRTPMVIKSNIRSRYRGVF